MKLLRTKSMILYLPPNGTAGLARSRVRGKSRVPLPPASTMPKTRGCRVLCAVYADSRSRSIFSDIPPSQMQCSCRMLSNNAHTYYLLLWLSKNAELFLRSDIRDGHAWSEHVEASHTVRRGAVALSSLAS